MKTSEQNAIRLNQQTGGMENESTDFNLIWIQFSNWCESSDVMHTTLNQPNYWFNFFFAVVKIHVQLWLIRIELFTIDFTKFPNIE